MDEQIDDEGTATDLTFDTVSPVNANNVESIEVDARISGYGDYLDGSNVCLCSSQECVAEFINKNFGCEICVSFQCDSGSLHACNPCSDSLGDPSSPDVGPAARN